MSMKTIGWCVGLLLLCGGMLRAQETQSKEPVRIAVMQPVDRSGDVPNGLEMIMQSQFVQALTTNPDYEPYERMDIGSIMQEHEFQRTGLVSEDQIRKLGMMNGVSQILVTEVASMGTDGISISAKVIDVESAKVENMATAVSELTMEAIVSTCRELTVKLFGGRDHVGKTIRL